MKIFNRGEAKQAKVEVPAAKPEPAPATPAPLAPPQPDLTAIIDANVKEMSEKIARLATSIESEHSDRADFEAKLERMEDRMRKLSSLTEMISAQYNPFVGSAPPEREPMPQPEVGLAMPPVALPPSVAAAAPTPLQALEMTLESPMAPPLLPLDALPPPPAPPAAPEALPDAPARVHAPDESWLPPEPEASPHHAAPVEPEDEPEPEDAHATARLWSIPTGFTSSMLAIKWADMLLRSAPSREGLVALVDYYQNIGWIGAPARDQLLAYADGILVGPDAPDRGEWRGHAELHERSLLYVEKIRALAGRRGD